MGEADQQCKEHEPKGKADEENNPALPLTIREVLCKSLNFSEHSFVKWEDYITVISYINNISMRCYIENIDILY